jgi:CHASE2 domain-containing sensor protein
MKRLGGRLRRALPIILVVAALTSILDRVGALARFEATGLDTLTRMGRADTPSDVVLVGISDEDYKTLFADTSPLKCDQLQRILNAVAADGPDVIGVDLDTSSAGFDCLKIAPVWPPLVWATEATWNQERQRFEHLAALHVREIRPVDVTALAEFPEDNDGVIRRYRRTFSVEGHEAMSSFPWAVVQAACTRDRGSLCAGVASTSDDVLRLNFAGDRFAFSPVSAAPILKMFEANAETAGDTVVGQQGPFTGKIVIVGGNYQAARDRHRTPLGDWPGMNIIAQAVESDLHGGGIHTLTEVEAFVVDVAIGCLLVAIDYWIMRQRWRSRLKISLLASVIGIPLLGALGSVLIFSTTAFWFNFVPVMMSVIVHELYEHAREYQHLLEEHATEGTA